MKIQIDVNEELNTKIKIDRLKKKLKNKQDLIVWILERYYGDKK